jgi:hypothetical protein
MDLKMIASIAGLVMFIAGVSLLVAQAALPGRFTGMRKDLHGPGISSKENTGLALALIGAALILATMGVSFWSK